jgi:hypothetical protein
MVITFPIVGLRVYSRMRFSKRLFEDDWCALISAVSIPPGSVTGRLTIPRLYYYQRKSLNYLVRVTG